MTQTSYECLMSVKETILVWVCVADKLPEFVLTFNKSQSWDLAQNEYAHKQISWNWQWNNNSRRHNYKQLDVVL